MKTLLAAAAASLLLAGPVFADETKGTDMTQVLVDGHNKVIKNNLEVRSDREQQQDPNCEKCADLRLGPAIAAAMRYSVMADPALKSGDQAAVQKALRSHFADMIETQTDYKLSPAQVEIIKKALNLTPLSGPVLEAILAKIDPIGWQRAVEQDAK